MNHFFITGLPRCRSAWFANYLTYGNTFCWHDGFDGAQDFDGFKERMEFGKFENVGNSDPANLLFWEEISFWYPKSKWVVIRRPFEDVVESCAEFGFERPLLESYWDRLIALENALDPLVVKFNELGPVIVKEVADYLGVKVGNPTRTSQLCKMNVQLDHDYLRERIAANISNPPKFLRETLA